MANELEKIGLAHGSNCDISVVERMLRDIKVKQEDKMSKIELKVTHKLVNIQSSLETIGENLENAISRNNLPTRKSENKNERSCKVHEKENSKAFEEMIGKTCSELDERYRK